MFMKLVLDQRSYVSPTVICTSAQITSSLHVSIPTPLFVCVCQCQWQGSVGVCWYWRCKCVNVCQIINPRFAGGRESRCMWLLCTARCFGLCFCLTPSLIEHPPGPSAGVLWTLLASVFLCLHPFDNLRLAFLSETDWLTDWLSDFQLILCCAVLAEFLHSLSHTRLFDVVQCLSFCIPSSSFLFAAALCEQEAVQQCLQVCVFLCFLSSLLYLPVYPPIRPSGAIRIMEMRSVPKTAWVFLPLHTNLSSLSTNWFSLHRPIHPQVTHGYEHPLAFSEELPNCYNNCNNNDNQSN